MLSPFEEMGRDSSRGFAASREPSWESAEGKAVAITALRPKGTSELPELAASLVKQDVEPIVTPASPAVAALKRATQTIPIVFALAADPVGSGFVANLARPGGDITGLSQLNVELSGKRVELLREASPSRGLSCCGSCPTTAPRSTR